MGQYALKYLKMRVCNQWANANDMNLICYIRWSKNLLYETEFTQNKCLWDTIFKRRHVNWKTKFKNGQKCRSFAADSLVASMCTGHFSIVPTITRNDVKWFTIWSSLEVKHKNYFKMTKMLNCRILSIRNMPLGMRDHLITSLNSTQKHLRHHLALVTTERRFNMTLYLVFKLLICIIILIV